MVEQWAAPLSTTMSLEDEITEAETLALADQAEADRLRARADELAIRASTRLSIVAAARSVLYGEKPPSHAGHEEPFCYESFREWP
jgi:hypothetical protein